MDDNYCRRCGRQITVTLPAVREPHLPAETRAIPPALLGSVAALAAGTALEWLARRLASNAAKGVAKAAGRALPKSAPDQRVRSPVPRDDGAVVVREFFYMRRVDLRR
jgi:hypothetical protein